MASASEAVAKAASYIGLNGRMFTSHYGWADNTPWCALFQSYVKDAIDSSLWESSAAVSGIVGQLKRVDDWEAQAGDLVAFNWDGRSDLGWMDHIGMVEWSNIDRNKNGYFGTIEGNYGDSNLTSRVTRVTRNNQGNYFTAFFRPNYSSSSGGTKPTPSPSPSGDLSEIRYRVMTDSGWLPEMIGWTDTDGSSDTWAGNGNPISYISIDMPSGSWYQVQTVNGWLDRVYSYNPDDLVNGAAGDGTRIYKLRCWYETPSPETNGYHQIEYSVANVGEDFLPAMIDLTDTDGSSDDYAGNGGTIARVRIRLVS